jgi:hypothetical protein
VQEINRRVTAHFHQLPPPFTLADVTKVLSNDARPSCAEFDAIISQSEKDEFLWQYFSQRTPKAVLDALFAGEFVNQVGFQKLLKKVYLL